MSLFSSTTYELSLVKGYVSHWGMVHAVRELIQNALDSESPFVYEFAQSDGVSALLLNSEFTTLTPQTLLLGATSKQGADTIGSFGEGYKIALLVLTRLGYDVEMRNGDVLWRPRFRHNTRFGAEVLVIDESPLADKTNKGLTFVVNRLSDSDVNEIRGSCLQMQTGIGEKLTTQFGDILLERRGKLYVGGLYICETSLAYSYNIKPAYIKLERDRQTVNSWDLKTMTRDMWFATEQYDRVAEMIEKNVPDLECAEYSSPEMVREACYQLFIRRNPGAVVAKSQDELRALVAQGMERVVVHNPNFHSNVSSAASYRTRTSVRVKRPTERLEEWFADAKYKMGNAEKKSFMELIKESKTWRISE